jgi:Family of unknown function (DUF6152)
MKLKSAVALLAAGLSLASTLLLAHHSFMAEFDQRRKISMEGVVTAVKWQNPHTYFYVDVADKNGKVVNWALETGSPNSLLVRGWRRDTMKPGDHVSVRGYRAKDGSSLAAAGSVTFADGRTLFGGQMDDGGPEQ